MKFDWREFLELAYDLDTRTATRYSREAARRTSVSRAYYAAFCHARNYAAQNLGFKPKRTGEDHQLLREHLEGLLGMWSEVAEDLDDLRKWRNQCDYDDSVLNLGALLREALENARKIIQECSERSQM